MFVGYCYFNSYKVIQNAEILSSCQRLTLTCRPVEDLACYMITYLVELTFMAFL